MAQHFFGEYSKELGKDINEISTYAMDIMSQYYFSGNLRELENIIERSVSLETSNIVLPHYPLRVQKPMQESQVLG